MDKDTLDEEFEPEDSWQQLLLRGASPAYKVSVSIFVLAFYLTLGLCVGHNVMSWGYGFGVGALSSLAFYTVAFFSIGLSTHLEILSEKKAESHKHRLYSRLAPKIETIDKLAKRYGKIVSDFDSILFQHLYSHKSGEMDAMINAKRIVRALENRSKEARKILEGGGMEQLQDAKKLLSQKLEIPIDAVNAVVGSKEMPSQMPSQWEPTLQELIDCVEENISSILRENVASIEKIIDDSIVAIKKLEDVAQSLPPSEIEIDKNYIDSAKVVVAALAQRSDEITTVLSTDHTPEDLKTASNFLKANLEIPDDVVTELLETDDVPEVSPLQWQATIEELFSLVEQKIARSLYKYIERTHKLLTKVNTQVTINNIELLEKGKSEDDKEFHNIEKAAEFSKEIRERCAHVRMVLSQGDAAALVFARDLLLDEYKTSFPNIKTESPLNGFSYDQCSQVFETLLGTAKETA